MTVQSIYHVGVVVSDLERSLEWYTNVLGLEVERPTRELTGDWISQVTGFENTRMKMAWVGTGGECSIELNEYVEPAGESGPADRDRNDVGTSHVGLEVDDVHAWYDRLSAAGVEFAGPPPPKLPNVTYPWARCAVYLRDPDGNLLELLERDPRPE